MGLDMYLYRANNDGDYNWQNDEIGYWRKANQIHAWFVENVQKGVDDCGDYVVSRDNVLRLLNTCKEVLNNTELIDGEVNNGYTFHQGQMTPIIEVGKVVKDSSVAEKLLPTQDGFFFGGTDYDEYYIMDLEQTISILERALDTIDFDNEKLIYSSSW